MPAAPPEKPKSRLLNRYMHLLDRHVKLLGIQVLVLANDAISVQVCMLVSTMWVLMGVYEAIDVRACILFVCLALFVYPRQLCVWRLLKCWCWCWP